MNTLSKQALKAKAHHLKPVVLLGTKGLTPAIVKETDIALTAHELIKIKLAHLEKKERTIIATHLCDQLHAELIQLIGNIAIIYRKNNNTTC